MLIRKLFKFEGAHIVRGCSSRRCSHSLHGHSYKVELLLEAHGLDHGQMIYDFGLLKGAVRELIDGFDHAVVFWSGDEPAYIENCRRFSERLSALPVSPSAEQLSRVFFCLVDAVLKQTEMHNGEDEVQLHSVIVHETDTGYAQCFRDDAYNARMGRFEIQEIRYAESIQEGWSDPCLLANLQAGLPIRNCLETRPA